MDSGKRINEGKGEMTEELRREKRKGVMWKEKRK